MIFLYIYKFIGTQTMQFVQNVYYLYFNWWISSFLLLFLLFCCCYNFVYLYILYNLWFPPLKHWVVPITLLPFLKLRNIMVNKLFHARRGNNIILLWCLVAQSVVGDKKHFLNICSFNKNEKKNTRPSNTYKRKMSCRAYHRPESQLMLQNKKWS